MNPMCYGTPCSSRTVRFLLFSDSVVSFEAIDASKVASKNTTESEKEVASNLLAQFSRQTCFS
jgi:hypothetical protein